MLHFCRLQYFFRVNSRLCYAREVMPRYSVASTYGICLDIRMINDHCILVVHDNQDRYVNFLNRRIRPLCKTCHFVLIEQLAENLY